MLLAASSGSAIADPAPADCHIGIYRLKDGSDVDIGSAEDGKLRWRRTDGRAGTLAPPMDSSDTWSSTLGWTEHADGIEVSLPPCAEQRIKFNGQVGTRIQFDVVNTRFRVEDAELAGRLVLPKGMTRVPLVILVHGSEHDSALDNYSLQRLFPAVGIGVFVYDKRGTGASSGEYTQDYLELAMDAIAAHHAALRLAGKRAGRIGYQGSSQGGWVAPLAAKIEPVDFVIVSFGLAVSPLQEDRAAIALNITRHGFGADAMRKAMEIADAAAIILSSDFRNGYERLDALREQYKNEPWFPYIRGDVTWVLLAKTPTELRELGPKVFAGIPVHYDPMPVLRNLAVPQLWLLGGEDIDAPSAETARRLSELERHGRPVRVKVFAHAEHGLYEFDTLPDGSRAATRQPPDYFKAMRDFIRDGSWPPR